MFQKFGWSGRRSKTTDNQAKIVLLSQLPDIFLVDHFVSLGYRLRALSAYSDHVLIEGLGLFLHSWWDHFILWIQRKYTLAQPKMRTSRYYLVLYIKHLLEWSICIWSIWSHYIIGWHWNDNFHGCMMNEENYACQHVSYWKWLMS